MSSRPSRSSNIPIPRSSSTSSSSRNIESVISIPFIPSSSRHHLPTSPTNTTGRNISDSRRAVSHGTRPISVTSNQLSTSPSTSTLRSTSLVSSVPTSRTSTFEPRVVRGSSHDHALQDLDAVQPSTSPSQLRRSSVTTRPSAPPRPVIPHHVFAKTPVSFARPSYLEFCALRHLIQTDPLPGPIPSRKAPSISNTRPQSYAHYSASDNDDDSAGTPPRAIPATTPVPRQKIVLPSRWSEHDRHPNLSLSHDGREVSYTGTTMNGDKDAAAIRTQHQLHPACGIYYYEIAILGKEQKAFASRSVKFTRLPGWELNSWGYYGENGRVLSGDKEGNAFGQPFGVGDIIGCGIDFTTQKVFYTKNGIFIGDVFHGIGKGFDLYPSIGLLRHGEVIRANFGQDPFKFDIDHIVQRQQSAMWDKILATPLDRTVLTGHRKTVVGSIASITNDTEEKPALSADEEREVINKLVMSYLVHHGYIKTAKVFERREEEQVPDALPTDVDVEMSNGASSSADGHVEGTIQSRTNAVNAVLNRDLVSAIEITRKHFPEVLEADGHLMLIKLRCRRFIELILEAAEIKKKMKSLTKEPQPVPRVETQATTDAWDDDMGMDIDDDAPGPFTGFPSTSSDKIQEEPNYETRMATARYEAALNSVLSYGKELSDDVQGDSRPQVQELFKTTFGVVAWEDPFEARSPIASLVGPESCFALANELNEAILKSQGYPARPALETLYRQASACVTELAWQGVGQAAFADVSRELLEL
ncbi:hypothetical protein CVT24_003516 [Panaeolus cyanescens]|uniref:B30.2/SPRY domain-containing protein n=1 Tax=Panaeolus cyanescens TaxID=181874 RepID=A0A409Y742_9AGAR|nr:hypothetical protein CVT24_003516 [Panaeolus cyanescens]